MLNYLNELGKLSEGSGSRSPMNTPARPGMTKEEIFDLMAEKLIRKGEKITPEMKQLMEMLAEKAAKELGKKDDKDSDGKTD